MIYFSNQIKYYFNPKDEFVNSDVHTNNIESFWALLKRGLTGIYQHASDEHLYRYLNEFTFRFNNKQLS